MIDKSPTSNDLNFLQGGGELGDLMRSRNWSQTLLGDIETWPQSLRSALSICLNSRFPIAIYWGQDFILLYNDAWRPIVGDKHPWAIGQPAREVWAEIWQDIGAELASVLATGEGTFHQDDLLSMHRFGYTEECFFEYTFNPIKGEGGNTDGVFNVVSETTYRVLNERRTRLLQDVASRTGVAKTVEASCARILETLKSYPLDLPFAQIYLIDSERRQAILCQSDPAFSDTPNCPAIVELDQEHSDDWLISLAAKTTQSQEINNLVERFGVLPGSPWSEPPQEAMILPIVLPGQVKARGVLIAIASPRRRLDQAYRNFFSQLAEQIALAIANTQAYEEERQRAEALAKLDQAKTTFFSNISHEFRTPLTLMLSPLEELSTTLNQRLNAGEQEQFQLIKRNGLRLQKLVNTLLDFSRIEAGRIQICYEATHLDWYTTELASAFRSLIEQAGLQFVIDCPTTTEPVYVDRGMWEKIVFNLLSNAFKFTFEGQIAIRLRSKERYIELSVEDTGVGIPIAEQSRIFERFHRISGMRSRTYEGSGIGLSLVQELVKLHHGQIQCTSTEGIGTCFTVSIPTGAEHLPPDRVQDICTVPSTEFDATLFVEEAQQWLPQESSHLNITNSELTFDSLTSTTILRSRPSPIGRILLADDNADMRRYLSKLLRKLYEVQVVSDGVEALSAIHQHNPDLVLTDLMMPNLDGLGLIQALRSDPETCEIPIILLSARAGEEARIEGIEAGADNYLTKPFAARELLARVEGTLKLSQARQEAKQREKVLRLEAEISREKIETVLSSMNDGFFILDQDWTYVYVNDRFREMTGKTREQLIGHKNWDVFADAVDTDIYFQFHRAMTEQVTLQFEYFYLPWQRWFEFRVYPSPNQLTIFALELTKGKLTERALGESEKRFHTLADNISQLVWMADARGEIFWFNRRWIEYTGIPLEQMKMGGNQQVHHPDYADRVASGFQASIQAQEAWEDTFPLRGKDGTYRWFLSQAIPIKNTQGQVLQWFGTNTDVTELTTIQATLEQRNQELDSFVHTVSHDLKAPLRAISNLSEWIESDLEDQLPPDNRHQLTLLRNRVQRMEAMINSLLLYSRVGRQQVPLETFNVAELLHEIVDSLDPPQEFSIEIDQHLPTLTTQRILLSQVLTNLLSNAMKHHTRVDGHLRIAVLDQPNVYQFEVQDDGPGIAVNDYNKIFDIFHTLKSQDSSNNTGIGLAIVKKIIEFQNGTVWLESSLGQGTTFFFTWPKEHN